MKKYKVDWDGFIEVERFDPRVETLSEDEFIKLLRDLKNLQFEAQAELSFDGYYDAKELWDRFLEER